METIDTPERAMLVIPHTDDGESGCAGTVAKWTAEGTKVLYVLATNGDKGTEDPDMTSERLAEIRAAEQFQHLELVGSEQALRELLTLQQEARFVAMGILD